MRAWPAYLEAVQDGTYYLSVDEVLGMCLSARVNVAVCTEIAGELTFDGGYFEGDGQPLCIKLQSNNRGSVRSHFERLVSVPVLQDWAKHIAAEKAEQARVEEAARLARLEAERVRRDAEKRECTK